MTAAPDTPATLGQGLRVAAAAGGGALVIHFADGPRRLDVPELLVLAEERAAVLVRRGLTPGGRVGIMGPTAIEWVTWSYAVWLAGGVVVPLPSPIRVRDADALRWQTESLCRAFGCRFVVAHARFLPMVPAGTGINWDEHDSGRDLGGVDDGVVEGDAPAYVHCTSGSTALPKGISLTHRSALLRSIGGSLLNPDSKPLVRMLSFVPLSHGGGSALVLSILRPEMENHLLPAERFARDPGELLRLVGPARVTLTGGPSSAVRAALRAVERKPVGVDLSGLELFRFSMEMTAPEVVDQLLEVGGRFGLRPEVVGANYGLSEGGATTTAPNAGLRIDEVDLDALVTEGRAVAPRPGAQTKRVVSCGWPLRRVELRIAGPDGALADRHVGEVQFRGPAVMKGYVVPGGEDPFDDGWLRTGDLGYVDDGELFVTGRRKEVIVRRGRNYHPEDLEWAAGRVAGVVAGRCVAFSPTSGEEGDVVVAVEVADAAVAPGEVEARVRAAVTHAVGLVPRHVLVLPDGAIPVAPAGKLQRLAARDAYERGELR